MVLKASFLATYETYFFKPSGQFLLAVTLGYPVDADVRGLKREGVPISRVVVVGKNGF